MRIGISGAQSVGKTTLLNALRSEPTFKDYSICDEVTRRVKSYGLLINEHGNDTTQRLIMQEHIINLFMHDNMITDRTSLDGLVYTKYLKQKGKVSQEILDYSYKIFEKTIRQYDLLFYIVPEFDIVDDGTRSTDIEFRDDIVRIFNDVIGLNGVNFLHVTGSVRQRTQFILDIYNTELEHRKKYNE